MAEEKEMSFLQHVEELRSHLVRSVLAILVGAILAFAFTSVLFDVVLFGPFQEDFPTKVLLCNLAESLNTPNLCLGELNIERLQNIVFAGQFTWHIWACFLAGVVLAFPYILYEVWRFIRPALRKEEKGKVRGIVFYSSILFFAGALFGYYVLSPMTIHFLGNYQVSELIENRPTFVSYLSTILHLTLGTGLVFELPVFIFFLARVGIVGPAMLKKYRRHAYVGILVLAAVVTPPDITSQVLITFPLIFLYEISIGIAARQYKEV